MALAVSPLVPIAPASAAIVNGSGLVTASGTDVGLYLGAGTFYNAGYTGTRATVVNLEGEVGWNGHQSLTHLLYAPPVPGTVQVMQTHATAVSSLIGGRGNRPLDVGIAHGATLVGAALATTNSGGPFSFTLDSFGRTYAQAARGFTPVGTNTPRRADVVNSSWGSGASFFGGSAPETTLIDSVIAKYGTAIICAAGNSGPFVNTLGIPNSAFNVITVGALRSTDPPQTNPSYNTISEISSRSPSFVTVPGMTQPALRAAVHLTAPGENFTVAAYDGPGTVPNWYRFNQRGTSYAAPMVAGAATLLADVGYDRFVRGTDRTAVDARVLKAVLMNSADKTTGWTNAQSNVSGVITTTQALDYNVGTGRLNMDRAFRQYTDWTAGNVAASLAPTLVSGTGWDFDAVSPGAPADVYRIGAPLPAGSMLTATLTWFTDSSYDDDANAAALTALADLSLEVYRVDGVAPGLVARSDAKLNTAEHLHFAIPALGTYEIRVNYLGLEYWSQAGSGATYGATSFALAWRSTPIPAPATLPTLAPALLLLARRRRLD